MIELLKMKKRARQVRASAEALRSSVGQQVIKPAENVTSKPVSKPLKSAVKASAAKAENVKKPEPEQTKFELPLWEGIKSKIASKIENPSVKTEDKVAAAPKEEPHVALPAAMKLSSEIKASGDEVKPRNVVNLGKPEVKKPQAKKDKKPRIVAGSQGLQALNLGKSYGDKPAVRDVSITVHRGEAVGLLGPNGAGKTTSFYMIMGLIKPDYGAIKLDGADITNLPVYRRARLGVGYLPQEASIFRGLTVEENIMAVLELVHPIKETRQIALEELLAEFSITHLRRAPAIALSGGERRRVEIARALASNPSFILLDEPLAGIDPVAVADIKELISHLKHRGIGVLITDHNVREALDLLDRAYVIHDGAVLMEGTPQEIVVNKEVRRVYLGEKFTL